MGLEKTVDAYVAGMVDVFREVRRVLRDDGVCWIVIGDTYSQGRNGRPRGTDPKQPARRFGVGPNQDGGSGVPNGNLIGVPWRVAFALQADGWILRSENIWHKRSPMPESVKTRTTRAHEQVFMLAKSERYFYDWFAVLEKSAQPKRSRKAAVGGNKGDTVHHSPGGIQEGCEQRNLRSVWTLSGENFKGAHFATFPTKLVRPLIKAGTSQKGICPNLLTKLRLRRDLPPDRLAAAVAYLRRKRLIPDLLS